MSTHALKLVSIGLLAAAIACPAAPAFAQHEGHAMPMPAPKPAPKPAAKKPAPKASPRPAVKPAARPATGPAPAAIDHAAMGHGAPAPKPPARPATKAKPTAADHAAMGHGAPAPKAALRPAAKRKATPRPAPPKRAASAAPAAVDHAAMGHGTATRAPATVDHAAMGHGTPASTSSVDHAAMGHGTPASAQPMDHSAMDHGAMDHGATQAMEHAAMGHRAEPDLPADAAPRTPIPALTEADRAAAFPPDAHGHAVHDQRAFSYWLVDRLEWQHTGDGSLGWEGLAWIGGDVDRVWLRTEGEASDGEVESGNAEVLYGRSVTAWWDVVAGVRHDFGHGPSRTYAAFGFQGLAPYKFEVEATAFVGASGRGGATLEAEYDTLVTNRLILQWQAETTLYAKDDAAIGVGSGLSKFEAGARLRYEFTKRFAPYVGVEFERAFGGTADFKRAEGEPARDTRLVAGIRFWF